MVVNLQVFSLWISPVVLGWNWKSHESQIKKCEISPVALCAICRYPKQKRNSPETNFGRCFNQQSLVQRSRKAGHLRPPKGSAMKLFFAVIKMGPILEGIKSWCKLLWCLFFWRENGEHTKEKEDRMKFWVPLSKISWPAFFSFAESKSRWSETSTDDLSEATSK